MAPIDSTAENVDHRVKRHRLSTRLWHWVNALTIFILFGSGLGIFNADPRLYWGQYGANFDHAWLTLSRFPGWITLPGHYDLAMSRRWHLAFALILGFLTLAYMLGSIVNGHIARDLSFRKGELASPHIRATLRAHLLLRFPKGGEAALSYNPLQKASYIAVIFILIPLLIGTGLTMSPGIDAAAPWLLDLFGGRQSARSIHFICAWGMAAFVAVHLMMVILTGPINQLRGMITGWYRVSDDRQ